MTKKITFRHNINNNFLTYTRFNFQATLTFYLFGGQVSILRAAFALMIFAKKFQSRTVLREKLQKTFSYEKGARKLLLKLTPYHLRKNRISRLKKEIFNR